MQFSSNNKWDVAMDTNSMIITYNTAVTGKASEVLGKECSRKRPGSLELFLTFVIRDDI